MMGDDLAGAGVTAKERLERIEKILVTIDEKLDNKASREEVMALELRLRTLEVEGSRMAREAIHKAEVLASERAHDIEMLESRLSKFDNELQEDVVKLRKDHANLSSRVSWAFGAVAAIVAASDVIIRLLSR